MFTRDFVFLILIDILNRKVCCNVSLHFVHYKYTKNILIVNTFYILFDLIMVHIFTYTMYVYFTYQGGFIMIYDRILSEIQRIDDEISHLRQQLELFPPGNLFFTQNGKYKKWFQSNGHLQNYISKKNRSFAEQLAIKKYLSYHLEDLIHEKESLSHYLNHHEKKQPKAPQLLSETSEYKEFLSPYFSSYSEELLSWQNESFESNPQYPEQLKQPTASGILVRSKSEALIDFCLYKNKIPFRYECALTIGNRIFYPDFTILHPYTKKIYYWEHFGLMDIPLYANKTYSKLHYYTEHGVIPNVNLITTFETKDSPLDPEYVEMLIGYHFL